ncbi:MAG: alpha/beta fold hydrolase [Solirubrobacteraceae bacterium MAG38_C4-C5]|nr:alpha/beta fold hydrolase [Candidatus Siliceabacter maunaloa]
MSAAELDRWVRRHRPASAGRRPLVCFPPAGAAASFFLELAAAAPAGVDPWALVYPGREVRIPEPPLTEMTQLANAVASVLAPTLDEPAILLGHSMGASVAFEAARELDRLRPGCVVHLIVSGRAGPAGGGPRPPVAPPTDEELVAGLRMLGGTPPEIFDSPDMLELLLPPMRHDYDLLARYQPRWLPPLAIPMTALVGDADPTVGIDAVRAWSEVCDAAFTAREVGGGHFYLQSSADEAAYAVADALAGADVLAAEGA